MLLLRETLFAVSVTLDHLALLSSISYLTDIELLAIGLFFIFIFPLVFCLCFRELPKNVNILVCVVCHHESN